MTASTIKDVGNPAASRTGAPEAVTAAMNTPITNNVTAKAEHAANRCFQQQTVRAGHVWLVLRAQRPPTTARANNQPDQRSDESGYEQSYPGPGSIADYRDHQGNTCDRACERSQTQFLVDPAHGTTRTQARSRGCGVFRIQGLKNSSRRCSRAIDGSPVVRLPSVRAWLGVIP